MVKALGFVALLACVIAVSTASAAPESDNTRNLRGAIASHNKHASPVNVMSMESRHKQLQQRHQGSNHHHHHQFDTAAMEALAKALNSPHQRMPVMAMEAKGDSRLNGLGAAASVGTSVYKAPNKP